LRRRIRAQDRSARATFGQIKPEMLILHDTTQKNIARKKKCEGRVHHDKTRERLENKIDFERIFCDRKILRNKQNNNNNTHTRSTHNFF
jgi:hypothetical protein